MLTKLSAEDVRGALQRLSAALPPSVDVEKLVEREPLVLMADVAAVLAEIRRLMPGRDPVAVLLADPTGCLDMQASGLKASMEIDDGIPTRG